MSRSENNTQIRTPLAHESAALHVTGRAAYVDDMARRQTVCISRWG